MDEALEKVDPTVRKINRVSHEELRNEVTTSTSSDTINLVTDAMKNPSKCELYTLSHDLTSEMEKIVESSLSPFQKKVLISLCQVPLSHYTTYKFLALHLSTSARAVGNVLRMNPFAPPIPCHRVIASSGRLGGFHGSWGRDGAPGLHDHKKYCLLRSEGVHFDNNGLALGSPWNNFSNTNFK